MTRISRIVRLTAAAFLVSASAAADGTTEHFFTVEIDEGRIASAAPVRITPGQTVVATLWNRGRDDASLSLRAVDALSGDTLAAAELDGKRPGAVSVMVLPLRLSEPRYVMFQPDGVPVRAKVNLTLRTVTGSVSAEALSGSWGRTYELPAVAKVTQVAAAPEILTEAHAVSAVVFNSGELPQRVTVYGWDYVTKQPVSSETQIVRPRRGVRFSIPAELASALTPIVPGGTANGVMGVVFEVEPLGGPAELTATVEAQAFGDVVLKRGYAYNPDLPR